MDTIKVLFLASEADPLIKVGGLGDVAGSLPRALMQLSPQQAGNAAVDIRLAIPFRHVLKKKIEHLSSFLTSRFRPKTDRFLRRRITSK